MRVQSVLAVVGVAAVLVGCGAEDGDEQLPPADPAAVAAGHIHGLGINPADRALMIATHSGLFRAGPDERRAQRVGDSHQDTMGFTVVGPDRFLGSGHPDFQELRENVPPLLGLIESNDGGKSWKSISLLGKADFHVLRVADERIFGFDATNGRLMVSTDGGRRWERHTPPEPLLDLAPHPDDPQHIVATGEQGLYVSPSGGEGWRPLAQVAGLLVWPRADALILVDARGNVHRSTDGGRTFEELGSVGGTPAALAAHGDDLYVALHTNKVKVSRDGGRTWDDRATA